MQGAPRWRLSTVSLLALARSFKIVFKECLRNGGAASLVPPGQRLHGISRRWCHANGAAIGAGVQRRLLPSSSYTCFWCSTASTGIIISPSSSGAQGAGQSFPGWLVPAYGGFRLFPCRLLVVLLDEGVRPSSRLLPVSICHIILMLCLCYENALEK